MRQGQFERFELNGIIPAIKTTARKRGEFSAFFPHAPFPKPLADVISEGIFTKTNKENGKSCASLPFESFSTNCSVIKLLFVGDLIHLASGSGEPGTCSRLSWGVSRWDLHIVSFHAVPAV